jgi:hypothetical protein
MMFRLLSLFFIVMILSCGRGMHEEGDSDVDEFEDERTEAMEQAILDFIRENPQEFIASDEEDEDLRAATGERQPPAPTERQTRQGSPAINYWDTNWGRLWTNPKTEFGYTKEGKEFRQKWRVPKAVANHIVEKCKVLDEDGRDLFGIKFHNKARVPIEFKVLIALRILARGNCADDIAEMSNGSKKCNCPSNCAGIVVVKWK